MKTEALQCDGDGDIDGDGDGDGGGDGKKQNRLVSVAN